MQRVVGLLFLVLVVFWIVDSPLTAAGTVTAILDLLVFFAGQVVEFLQALF